MENLWPNERQRTVCHMPVQIENTLLNPWEAFTGGRAEGESASWEGINNRNKQSLRKALNSGA